MVPKDLINLIMSPYKELLLKMIFSIGFGKESLLKMISSVNFGNESLMNEIQILL
jgi:hypothetical protein